MFSNKLGQTSSKLCLQLIWSPGRGFIAPLAQYLKKKKKFGSIIYQDAASRNLLGPNLDLRVHELFDAQSFPILVYFEMPHRLNCELQNQA